MSIYLRQEKYVVKISVIFVRLIQYFLKINHVPIQKTKKYKTMSHNKTLCLFPLHQHGSLPHLRAGSVP